jgi:hypothetical protein
LRLFTGEIGELRNMQPFRQFASDKRIFIFAVLNHSKIKVRPPLIAPGRLVVPGRAKIKEAEDNYDKKRRHGLSPLE